MIKPFFLEYTIRLYYFICVFIGKQRINSKYIRLNDKYLPGNVFRNACMLSGACIIVICGMEHLITATLQMLSSMEFFWFFKKRFNLNCSKKILLNATAFFISYTINLKLQCLL